MGERSSFEQRRKMLDETFEKLDVNDFYRTFKNKYKQAYKIPRDVRDAIFNKMGKTTERGRNVD